MSMSSILQALLYNEFSSPFLPPPPPLDGPTSADQSNHHFSFSQSQGTKNAAAHSRFAFARSGDGNASSEGQNFGFSRNHHSASSFYSESDDGKAIFLFDSHEAV